MGNLAPIHVEIITHSQCGINNKGKVVVKNEKTNVR